eukprot:10690354-Lingulodinium_polyedra.AAC.1
MSEPSRGTPLERESSRDTPLESSRGTLLESESSRDTPLESSRGTPLESESSGGASLEGRAWQAASKREEAASLKTERLDGPSPRYCPTR